MKELFKNVYAIESVESSENGVTLTMKSIDSSVYYTEGKITICLPYNETLAALQTKDLVRYIRDNKKCKITSVPFIKYPEYKEAIENIDQMTKDEIVELYNSSKGVIAAFCEYSELSENFIKSILDYNFGYCIVKEMPSGIKDFINSKEVSDYFKEAILNKIRKSNGRVRAIVSSDVDFKDMSEEEFSTIFDVLNRCRKSQFESSNLCDSFFVYAMNLDSEGARVFLNREDLRMEVIERIVDTSGLCSRPSYYSGGGTSRGDLDENMLIEIYKKLRRIDVDKADSMGKMTLFLNNLGATYFLNNLYALVENNYDLAATGEVYKDYSYGKAKGRAKTILGLCTVLSYQGRDLDRERRITAEMQNIFALNVRKIKLENQELVDAGQVLRI